MINSEEGGSSKMLPIQIRPCHPWSQTRQERPLKQKGKMLLVKPFHQGVTKPRSIAKLDKGTKCPELDTVTKKGKMG